MRRIVLLLGFLLVLCDGTARAESPWLNLPPTPGLPTAAETGYAPVNGVKIWYAIFGRGMPVILLHGGLANSNYWGNLIPSLAEHYQVIVMDSRGHGRSTRSSEPLGYNLMTSDVLAVMDFLKLDKTAVVGWSDGAIIGLNIAIHHPARLTKLFAFAANSDPSGVTDISQSPMFNKYLARTKLEYESLSSTPGDYGSFFLQIATMWLTQPNFTADDFHRIKCVTWIVDGDHDEAVKRANTLFIADQIPDSGLLIEPQVSHFAFLQDPEQFNSDVLHFLRHAERN